MSSCNIKLLKVFLICALNKLEVSWNSIINEIINQLYKEDVERLILIINKDIDNIYLIIYKILIEYNKDHYFLYKKIIIFYLRRILN